MGTRNGALRSPLGGVAAWRSLIAPAGSAPASPMSDTLPAPIIDVDGVDFSYGRLQVLFGVSLQVEEGEALALLGTNGARKSTLLRLLCGLERPSSGTIAFEGRDITGAQAERLVGRGLALISGGHAVFPDLTVRENLDIQALPIHRDRKAVRDRTAQVLDTFPVLGRYLRRRAGSLSGASSSSWPWPRRSCSTPRSSASTSCPSALLPWWSGSAWPSCGPCGTPASRSSSWSRASA